MTFDATSSSNRLNSDSADLEHRMRRTLGVDSSSHGKRRRFAQDGDVPGVIRGRRDADRDAAEAEVQAGREARQQVERLLTAAQATIRDLQTKLAHAEMTLSETREALVRSHERAQALEATSAERRAVAEVGARRLAKEASTRKVAKTDPEDEWRNGYPTPDAKIPRRSVGKIVEHQQPVDWWSKHEKRK